MDIDGITGKDMKEKMTPAKKEPVEQPLASSNTSTELIGGRVILSWDGTEGSGDTKTAKYYIIASLVVLIILGILIWQQDWFSIGILVIVSAVFFWYLRGTKTKAVTYKITPLGMYVDANFHPFAEIHSFWMVYNQGVHNLYFAFVKKYLPSLIVDVRNVDPNTLRTVLLRKIPEQEKRGESTIDKIIRTLGL